MRKSLPKTPHSGLSSSLEPLPALLAVAVGRRRAAKANGSGGGAARSAVIRDGRLEARLRLLEGFLSRSSIADCAQHALQWLETQLGFNRSICLVRAGADQALATIASRGLSARTTASFTVSVEDWNNPLVGALNARRLIYCPSSH